MMKTKKDESIWDYGSTDYPIENRKTEHTHCLFFIFVLIAFSCSLIDWRLWYAFQYGGFYSFWCDEENMKKIFNKNCLICREGFFSTFNENYTFNILWGLLANPRNYYTKKWLWPINSNLCTVKNLATNLLFLQQSHIFYSIHLRNLFAHINCMFDWLFKYVAKLLVSKWHICLLEGLFL